MRRRVLFYYQSCGKVFFNSLTLAVLTVVAMTSITQAQQGMKNGDGPEQPLPTIQIDGKTCSADRIIVKAKPLDQLMPDDEWKQWKNDSERQIRRRFKHLDQNGRRNARLEMIREKRMEKLQSLHQKMDGILKDRLQKKGRQHDGKPLLRVLKTLRKLDDIQVIEVPEETDIKTLCDEYMASGLCEYAEPDYIYSTCQTFSNDPLLIDGTLWSLHNTGQNNGTDDADIDAVEAWDIRHDASGIVVAVVDTGIRYTHEDLAPNMWVNADEIPGNMYDDDNNGYEDDVYGVNSIYSLMDVMDDHGHGTHVAGTVGASGNNGLGVAGVAWQVQLMACKALAASGSGQTSWVAESVIYAVDNGAHVINMSLGGTGYSQALYDAIDYARVNDVIVVAAAGNQFELDNDVRPVYPACFDLDNIIAVANTDRNDQLTASSHYGLTSVDLGAPGTYITSTGFNADNDYLAKTGTSMASPHVAGAVAILKAQFPVDTTEQLILRVLDSVDPLPALAGKTVTGGRLNLHAAMNIDVYPPDAPTNLVCTAGSSSHINLSWVDQSSNEASFVIERAQESGAFKYITEVTAETTSYMDASLTASTTYHYRIKASNQYGTSAYSNDAGAQTFDEQGGDHTPPSAPQNLLAVAGGQSVDLFWTANAEPDLDGYHVYRFSPELSSYYRIASLSDQQNDYTDSSLEYETEYSYIVTAFDTTGNESDDSNEVVITTLPPVPSSPRNLDGIGVVSQGGEAAYVTLLWEESAINEDSIVVRRRESGGSFTDIATLPPNTIQYLDDTVTDQIDYDYQVVAVNIGGQSDPSNTVTISVDIEQSVLDNLVVSIAADELDNNYSENDLSLREAMELARFTSAIDDISFSSQLTGQSILLNPGLGQLVAKADMNILGPGMDLLTVSGQDQCRVLFIDENSHVTIEGLTVSHGYKTTEGDPGYDTDAGGGGIANWGELMLSDVKIDSNNAYAASGIVNWHIMEMDHCVVSNNLKSGIFNKGECVISYTDIINNLGEGSGAGVYNDKNLTLSRCLIDNNSCGFGEGGGIYNRNSGNCTITDSTITNNYALFEGGGVQNRGEMIIRRCIVDNNTTDFSGGGINSLYGTITIINSTITGNQGSGHGSGMNNGYGSDAVLINVTVTDNRNVNVTGDESSAVFHRYWDIPTQPWNHMTGSMAIYNSIIAGNYRTDTMAYRDVDGDFEPVSSHNLIGTIDRSTGLNGSGALYGTDASPLDPELLPLADNGGLTPTHALDFDSPAIDAGDSTLAAVYNMVYDQRGDGFSRVIGDQIDIGAFEDQQILPPAASIPGTDQAPVIDGFAESIWDSVPDYTIDQVVIGSIGSASDLSGSWKAMWDQQNLYYLVDVTDDARINDSGSNWWDDDVVELYIDADNSKGTSYDGVNDFQYGLRVYDGAIHVGQNSVNNTTGVQFSLQTHGSGYRLEIAVPWSTLGVTPAADMLIGTDVILDDDDNNGGRDAQMTWHADDGTAWQNPGKFGTGRLGYLPADADIAHTGIVPAIDGVEEMAWVVAEDNDLSRVVIGSVSSGSDLSVTWRGMWDSQNLYYLVKVTDESLVNDSGANWWDDDVVELYIDADNSKGSSYDGVNDFQFGFRVSDSTIHVGQNSVNQTTGIVFALTPVTNGYNLEISIPWSTLGVSPGENMLIGTDIIVDDDDNGGGRDAQMTWHSDDTTAWQNPGKFGEARLAD